jgi:hypothetical protein
MSEINNYTLKLLHSLAIKKTTTKQNNTFFFNIQFDKDFKKKNNNFSGKVKEIIEPNEFTKILLLGELNINEGNISNKEKLDIFNKIKDNTDKIDVKNYYPLLHPKDTNTIYDNSNFLFKYKLVPSISNNNITTNIIYNINNITNKKDFSFNMHKRNGNVTIPLSFSNSIDMFLEKINNVHTELLKKKPVKLKKQKYIKNFKISGTNLPSFDINL